MATTYPAKIDTSVTLPTAVDSLSPVKGAAVNVIRDAVLAIQGALGAQPGSSFGTVAARLVALENSIVSGGVDFGGDLMGTNDNQTVIGLQGTPVNNFPPASGQILGFNGSNWLPINISTIFTAGGDLSGTSTNQNVINVHGASVPIAGALITGNTLQVSGSSSLTYAPVNLAGGSNYVTGVLSVTNLPSLSGDTTGSIISNTVVKIQGIAISSTIPISGQVLEYNGTSWAPTNSASAGAAGGDLSGTYPNPTVSKLNTATVPVAGSLTTGNVLQVNGASTLTYAPLNLAGGVNYITGTLPVSNLPALLGDVTGSITTNTVTKIRGVTVSATAPTTGQVLEYNGSSWIPTNLPGTFVAGGDLSGTNTDQTVVAIQGIPVSNIAPALYQYLLYDGSGYTPFSPPNSLPPGGPASGDLGGSYPNPQVVALQGNPVSINIPSAGNVLTWNGTNNDWEPDVPALVSFEGDLSGNYTMQFVVGLQGRLLSGAMPDDGNVLTWNDNNSMWSPEPPAIMSTLPIVFNGTNEPFALPSNYTATLWSDINTDQLRLQDASGAILTLGGASFDGYAEDGYFGLDPLPTSSGVTTLRDRIDTMFGTIDLTDVIFNYQMPNSSFGSIARFKGTIQGISGTVGDLNYVGIMYDIDFIVMTSPGGTPTAVGASTLPNGMVPTWNDVIVTDLPILTVTPGIESVLNFDISNAYVNNVDTYWQIAIDVTLMQTLE